jgi:hypothetical protein
MDHSRVARCTGSGLAIRRLGNHWRRKAPNQGETKMNKYEAAEVIVLGAASDTVLGEKTLQIPDFKMGEFRQEETQMFDE